MYVYTIYILEAVRPFYSPRLVNILKVTKVFSINHFVSVQSLIYCGDII